jgi:hypothetical protein
MLYSIIKGTGKKLLEVGREQINVYLYAFFKYFTKIILVVLIRFLNIADSTNVILLPDWHF